jgi:sulfite exporter TauE/SafE
MQGVNLIAIFLTGLLAGGLSCAAVQGGLLTATIAQREEEKLKEGLKNKNIALPVISFLVTKLIAYSILGFFLGWLGSFFQLSITLKVILQIAVAVFMIGTALNILKVHPIFKYFVIQPPKFTEKLIKKQTQSKDIFAPALLGAFTIFIPCGITQAMMAIAISTGNPIFGALILFVFILGTSPLFFLIGYFTAKLGDVLKQTFMKFIAFVIIVLALFTLNSAVSQTGSPYTLGNLAKGFWCTVSFCSDSNQTNTAQATTDPAITIEQAAYAPNDINIKAGEKITLHITNEAGNSCIQAFTIPALGIQKIIPVGSSDTITFTAPPKGQDLVFSCSMGMYRGTFHSN